MVAGTKWEIRTISPTLGLAYQTSTGAEMPWLLCRQGDTSMCDRAAVVWSLLA